MRRGQLQPKKYQEEAHRTTSFVLSLITLDIHTAVDWRLIAGKSGFAIADKVLRVRVVLSHTKKCANVQSDQATLARTYKDKGDSPSKQTTVRMGPGIDEDETGAQTESGVQLKGNESSPEVRTQRWLLRVMLGITFIRRVNAALGRILVGSAHNQLPGSQGVAIVIRATRPIDGFGVGESI